MFVTYVVFVAYNLRGIPGDITCDISHVMFAMLEKLCFGKWIVIYLDGRTFWKRIITYHFLRSLTSGI